jgi:hypothetical protein
MVGRPLRLLLLREIGDPAVELADCVLELRFASRVRRQLELTLQLGAREPARLELPEALRVTADGRLTCLTLFLFAFFHALGEAGFRIDESFSSITHVYVSN